MRHRWGESWRGIKGQLPYIGLLVLANLIVMWDYWTGHRVFTSKDFLTSFYPLLNFQSDCLQDLSWPLWNPYMNFGYPFVEHYANTALFPSHLLMGMATGSTLTLIVRELLLWMVIGGIGVYLCVREFGSSPAAGMVAGVSYMLCGQFMALPQWSLIVYDAAALPFLVLGYHRAARQGSPLSLLSIAFLSMAFTGGYLSSMVYCIYIFSGYVLVDAVINGRKRLGIMYLVITMGASLLLALPKLLPLYNAIASGPRIASYEPVRDPFNTVNLYNFLSFLVPVKYYFSLYIGEICLLALIYGLLKRRLRVDANLIMFVLSAWLLLVHKDGSVSLLRTVSYGLPMMKVARNEWINWFYPSFFVILYASRCLDGFFFDNDMRSRAASAAMLIAAVSAAFWLSFNTSYYLAAYIAALAIVIAWSCIPLLNRRKAVFAAACAALVTAEFLVVAVRVRVDDPPVRNGDYLEFAVQDQGLESRSYLDPGTREKFPARMLRDDLRPSISASRGYPFLTSGLSGAPAYNISAEQYGAFIDSMNLKRFAGWWHNTQERFDFIQIKDSPMLAAMEGWPLFGLLDKATGRPLDNTASFDGISCSSFSFGVNAPSEGFFLLHQLFDPRWRVYVDGSEQPVRRANSYFMGVDLPPGRHAVVFRFSDRAFNASVAVSLLTLAGLIIVLARKARRSRVRQAASA